MAGVAEGESVVPLEIGLGQNIVPAPVGVVVAEPVAPVVAVPAELSLAALRFEFASVGPESEVSAVDRDRLAGLGGTDHASAVAVGSVDPAIEAELEPIEPVLLVPWPESCEEHVATVGLAIAVGVLGIEDVRRAGDDDPFPPRNQAGGEAEAVEERGRFVVATVAVGVFQDPDNPAELPFVVDSERVVTHLDDPELAVGAPVEGDRIFDQGSAAISSTWNPGRTRKEASRGLLRLAAGLNIFEQVVERAAIDQVGELGGVFVLPPEMAGVEPEAVVAGFVPASDDPRQYAPGSPALPFKITGTGSASGTAIATTDVRMG